MSAVVCGSKRSYHFDDLPSPPVSKKHRCRSSSTSPNCHSPSSLHHLKSVFPHTDPQLIESTLEECGNDVDSAVKSLHEQSSFSTQQEATYMEQGTVANNGDTTASENASVPGNLPGNGTEWVDLFVREMMSATSIDDARARAARMLEILENSIAVGAATEAAQSIQEENMILKGQIETLIRENSILKKAVAIQHERQKEFDVKNQEVQHLKQLVSQYQEQLRTLEVNNYALRMHLQQAQQTSSIPGRFHPDVF